MRNQLPLLPRSALDPTIRPECGDQIPSKSDDISAQEQSRSFCQPSSTDDEIDRKVDPRTGAGADRRGASELPRGAAGGGQALGLRPARTVLGLAGRISRARERTVQLKNGATVLIRPARASDAGALQAQFHRLTPDQVYTRFFRRGAFALLYGAADAVQRQPRDRGRLPGLDPAAKTRWLWAVPATS
jgi:hypothetical protein